MNTQAITTVVVNHNAGPLLAQALDGLAHHSVAQVIVVDNDSDDSSEDAARRPGVELIEPGRNLGFAEAVNLALTRTNHPMVLLLNADVCLGPRYVGALAEALAADQTLAGVTGVLRLPGGAVDSSGIEMTRARWASDRDRGELDARHSSPFGVSGAAALYRREALEVGLWGELFVYWEDVELAWRLRRAGWRFATVPQAVAEHQRGSDRRPSLMVEAASFGGRLAAIARHEGLLGLVQPGSAAVTAIVAARLALRHPRSLLAARPLRRVRAGLEARRLDVAHGWPPLARSAFDPHPWRGWITAQLTGARRGSGALPEAPRLPPEMS